MGYDLFELAKKYNQFRQMIQQSNQNPRELLESELKRRNINPQQLSDMMHQAQQLMQLFGGR